MIDTEKYQSARQNMMVDLWCFILARQADIFGINHAKYQPARQNMKFVTRSLRSLVTKLHILARQADIFGINQFTSR
jgi:hypothetical protein